MVRSLYFSNRKEYYRRKNISIGLKKYWEDVREGGRIRGKPKTYFINFEIAESRGYVVGSLSSPKKIGLATAKIIIKNTLPNDYTPVNFYEAEENTKQKDTILVLMREDDLIFEEVLNGI